MTSKITRLTTRIAMISVISAAAAGCNTLTRLSEVGDGPALTKITNPTAMASYRPISMPMPKAEIAFENPNSLWRSGARAFFKDNRAKVVGDILTVKLNLSDSAVLANKTERDRDDSEDTNVTSLLGYETTAFNTFLPDSVDPTSLLSFDSVHSTKGDGDINRSETISLTFAAVVTQILPNGHLAILGRQEIRVNKELRELLVRGVVRPEDIESDNTVTHEKIAEMRVAYGGRGTLSDLQQPRWGTQLWDIIFPF